MAQLVVHSNSLRDAGDACQRKLSTDRGFVRASRPQCLLQSAYPKGGGMFSEVRCSVVLFRKEH
jgi:hypothetical protein